MAARVCFICERELEEDSYVRSSVHKGRKYCLPGEGCFRSSRSEQNDPDLLSAETTQVTSAPA